VQTALGEETRKSFNALSSREGDVRIGIKCAISHGLQVLALTSSHPVCLDVQRYSAADTRVP